jgi:hypothetical protein
VRQEIYKEFAKVKEYELRLIEDDLPFTEKELARKIKRLESKRYREAQGEK